MATDDVEKIRFKYFSKTLAGKEGVAKSVKSFLNGGVPSQVIDWNLALQMSSEIEMQARADEQKKLADSAEWIHVSQYHADMILSEEKGKAEGIKQGREEALDGYSKTREGKVIKELTNNACAFREECYKQKEKIASLEKEIEELKANVKTTTECFNASQEDLTRRNKENARLRSALEKITKNRVVLEGQIGEPMCCCQENEEIAEQALEGDGK